MKWITQKRPKIERHLGQAKDRSNQLFTHCE